jgi:hypothetical protein
VVVSLKSLNYSVIKRYYVHTVNVKVLAHNMGLLVVRLCFFLDILKTTYQLQRSVGVQVLENFLNMALYITEAASWVSTHPIRRYVKSKGKLSLCFN